MAGFGTHFTTSTVVGIGYGAAGLAYGIPPSTCMVGAGACSLAGILPDLDSDSGRPVKEIMSFTAAMIPAMMIPRFHQMGLNSEQIVLAVAMVYLAIRFGVGDAFKRYTVHRGMWHSIPAAAVVGLIAFLCVSGSELPIRLFKSAAFVLGFLVHLVLDEIWSIEVRRGRMRIKKSFGTALKFFTTKGLWPNLSTYGKLVALVALVIGDPYLMDQIGVEQPELPESSRQWFEGVVERAESKFRSDELPSAEGAQELPTSLFGSSGASPTESTGVSPPEAAGVSSYESPGYDQPAYETSRREQPPRYEEPPRYQEPSGYEEPPRYATPPEPTYRPPADFGPPPSGEVRTPSYYPPTGSPGRY